MDRPAMLTVEADDSSLAPFTLFFPPGLTWKKFPVSKVTPASEDLGQVGHWVSRSSVVA